MVRTLVIGVFKEDNIS